MLHTCSIPPNNPNLPLLIYKEALGSRGTEAAGEFERLFAENGWRGSWRNGVFSYHHFHSNAHEVLGVCAGSAEVQFGGPQGPVHSVKAGDVAILPTGSGHKRINASSDFLVVGAYPAGQENYDLMRGETEERQAAEQRIAATPLPEADPVYGTDGPLCEHWARD
ncbi:MAG: cupin domain-containing protein [Pirellulaceae bacterium]